ncbi:hypothetical protein FRC03_007935 [Tulasnella sp. 419]|nr:hypothetical protein FRC03_007935 [Tulasnella sp. 419]
MAAASRCVRWWQHVLLELESEISFCVMIGTILWERTETELKKEDWSVEYAVESPVLEKIQIAIDVRALSLSPTEVAATPRIVSADGEEVEIMFQISQKMQKMDLWGGQD